jgi:hypothetical protein
MFSGTASDNALKSLWTRLTSLIADSSFKSAVIDLPAVSATQLQPGQDVATIFDDTKNSAVVLLQNSVGLSDKAVAATLNLFALKNGTSLQTPFPAQSIVADEKRQTLTLTFPSLTKWGIDDFDRVNSKLLVNLSPCPDKDKDKENCRREFTLSLVKATDTSEEKAAFSFTSQVKAIVAKDGVGSVDVSIDKLDKTKYDSVKISWSGGMFVSATQSGNALAPNSGAVTIADNTTIAFTFRNLVAQVPLVLTAEGLKDKKSVAKAAPLQFSIN